MPFDDCETPRLHRSRDQAVVPGVPPLLARAPAAGWPWPNGATTLPKAANASGVSGSAVKRLVRGVVAVVMRLSVVQSNF